MLEIGATVAFTLRLELRGGINGKLAPEVVAARDIAGSLFTIRLGEVSEPNTTGWAGGRVDGKVLEDRFSVLLTGGNKEDGNSGRLGVPVGNV